MCPKLQKMIIKIIKNYLLQLPHVEVVAAQLLFNIYRAMLAQSAVMRQ